MSDASRAEAFVIFRAGQADEKVLAAARRSVEAQVELEARPGRVHVMVTVKGTPAEALKACASAALALIEALGDDSAMIESLRRLGAARSAVRTVVSRPGARPRPQTLMGEVAVERPPPDNAREAFRAFMTAKRLRPTTWAKDAGITTGEIMGFLTGRSRGFSPDVAEKLARAARVRVEDMFR
jgi:hypothetical protein